MPVTFRSKAYENITMVRKDADKLLEMMGHSGTIPSALGAADIPGALERLNAALASAEAQETAAPEAADKDSDYDDSERRKEKNSSGKAVLLVIKWKSSRRKIKRRPP